MEEDGKIKCNTGCAQRYETSDLFLSTTVLDDKEPEEEESDEEKMAKYSYFLVGVFLLQILCCCCLVMCTGARIHKMEREMIKEQSN